MTMFVCSADAKHELTGVGPKFCGECGSPTKSIRCTCGNTLTDKQKFCEVCGKEVHRQ